MGPHRGDTWSRGIAGLPAVFVHEGAGPGGQCATGAELKKGRRRNRSALNCSLKIPTCPFCRPCRPSCLFSSWGLLPSLEKNRHCAGGYFKSLIYGQGLRVSRANCGSAEKFVLYCRVAPGISPV